MASAMRAQEAGSSGARSKLADHLLPFIGVIKGAPPRLSESADDVYR
jgi:hypothetical protein